MNSPQSLCSVDDIADGAAIAVVAQRHGETLDILLLRRGDRVHAYHNVCPHAGRRLDYAPGMFLVRGDRLICAAHGATFDVTSGRCVGGPGGGALRSIVVNIRDNRVWLVEPIDDV